MKRKKGYYSISVVAEMFCVHQQTVRMYEKEGLITPKRTEGNTRLFSEEDVDKLTKKVCQLVESSKGKVTSSSLMGKKALSYPINHIKEASYVMVGFELEASAIKEFSGKLKLEENIIRFLVIKV